MTVATQPRRPPRSPLRRILGEPLLQFLVLGSVLFLAAHGVAKHRDEAAREIVVDASLTQRLATLYESQTGSRPTPERIRALVDEYVRDEVLFREALKMGLDQNDEIVRRRLTQKIDFLQRDLTVVAEPDEGHLRQFYQEHLPEFTDPATVGFTHVYFSPDAAGSEAAHKRAEATLARLNGAASDEARKSGDAFPLQDGYAALTREDAVQLFGETPIIDGLFAAPLDQWIGPFQSGYGWHLVRVSRKEAAAPAAFERVRDAVRTAWLQQARNEANARTFETLKANYVIVHQAAEPRS